MTILKHAVLHFIWLWILPLCLLSCESDDNKPAAQEDHRKPKRSVRTANRSISIPADSQQGYSPRTEDDDDELAYDPFPADPRGPDSGPDPDPSPKPEEPPPPEEPQQVPTPPKYEGLWTFKDFCMAAEDMDAAMRMLSDFPNKPPKDSKLTPAQMQLMHLRSWQTDIQMTVGLIRLTINSLRAQGEGTEASCDRAYKDFQAYVQRTGEFSLAGKGIENADPIAGLPGLKRLDLSNNRIFSMTFLRQLTGLQILNLNRNLIPGIPTMKANNLAAGTTGGFFKLHTLFLQFQSDPGSTLKIKDGMETPGIVLKNLYLAGNVVDPESLRFIRDPDFKVDSLETLEFKKGQASCKVEDSSKRRYPKTYIEPKRADVCEGV